MNPHRLCFLFHPALLVLVGAGCLMAPVLGACQSRAPAGPMPRMKWLVMPFAQPPSMSAQTRAVQGWWLGARTIRQNPRAGHRLAEQVARQMAKLEAVNLFSRIDLKYYFADKRQALQEAYPHLSRQDADELVTAVPPVDYGRELGADKVLTGRIVREHLAENRTFHWWWSVLEVECEVVDVRTGRREWTRRYELERTFASPQRLETELARRLIEDLRTDYLPSMIEP